MDLSKIVSAQHYYKNNTHTHTSRDCMCVWRWGWCPGAPVARTHAHSLCGHMEVVFDASRDLCAATEKLKVLFVVGEKKG